jgi:hypothetical protein
VAFESQYIRRLEGRWDNALIHHRLTGEHEPLLQRRGALTTILAPLPKQPHREVAPTWPQRLLYVVVERDTNGDGQLTQADHSAAYACAANGNDPVRLTPKGVRVLRLRLLPGSPDRVVCLVEKDRKANYFLIDMNRPTEGRPLLPDDARQQIVQWAQDEPEATQGQPAESADPQKLP